MQFFYGVPEDIEKWMNLVTQVRWNFPGLETQDKLNEHRATVLKFMGNRQAICVKEENEIVGVMLFSRGHNMICCLAVAPAYRRRGVAAMLMDEALANLDRTKEISVSTFRADDEKGPAPRALYEKYGFVADELIEEFDYPNQKFVLHPIGAERQDRQLAINSMVREISHILADCEPAIYMYGSSALDDFRLGWSDIDILVLTEKQISESQANLLVGLRQAMLTKEPNNLYYRSFEGGMLTQSAFLANTTDRVVYWGTSGERITDRYLFDSFGMAELIESSVLLYGKDIRKELKYPDFHELYADVKHHYETIRKYAQSTGRNYYSFGWLLDITRCIYTLRTGKIIAKTKAAEWALENNLCPDLYALTTALNVRRNPLKYRDDKEMFDYAETLGESVQRFADVLEKELGGKTDSTYRISEQLGLPCYCGHDCSKCVTYVATQTNNDDLRRQAQSFYKERLGLDIPREKFYCDGGRSKNVFELCKECPFKKCCLERDIDACNKCSEYPCKDISDYQEKYVNKCNQLENKR